MAKQEPKFRGRVSQFPLGAAGGVPGIEGPHQVWFPKSKADVAAAVALTRNLRTFVRSGIQATVSDVIDATGGVINLAGLANVSAKGDVVTAEAASTVGALAEQLVEHKLALPLSDNRVQSVASAVLRAGPSSLQRTLGPLSGYVVKVEGVRPDGRPVNRSGAKALDSSRADNVVVTAVAFKGAKAAGLWMVRVTLSYPGKEPFAALVAALFVGTNIPPRADLILDARSARHNVPVVRVTATGSAKADRTSLTKLITQAVAGVPAEFAGAVVRDDFTGSGVMQAIVDAGFGLPIDPEVDARRFHEVAGRGAGPARDEFLARVCDEVDRGLAFHADGAGKVEPNLRLYTRLQLDRDGRLELSGQAYTPRPVPAAPPAPRSALALAPAVSFETLARAETPLHFGFDFRPAVARPIPGFRGTYSPRRTGTSAATPRSTPRRRPPRST